MKEDKFLKRIGISLATLSLIGVLGGLTGACILGRKEETIISQRQTESCYSERYDSLWKQQSTYRNYEGLFMGVMVLSGAGIIGGLHLRKLGEKR